MARQTFAVHKHGVMMSVHSSEHEAERVALFLKRQAETGGEMAQVVNVKPAKSSLAR